MWVGECYKSMPEKHPTISTGRPCFGTSGTYGQPVTGSVLILTETGRSWCCGVVSSKFAQIRGSCRKTPHHDYVWPRGATDHFIPSASNPSLRVLMAAIHPQSMLLRQLRTCVSFFMTKGFVCRAVSTRDLPLVSP